MKIACLAPLVFIACLALCGCKTKVATSTDKLIDDEAAALVKNGSAADIVEARRIAENMYRPAYAPADQQRDQQKQEASAPIIK